MYRVLSGIVAISVALPGVVLADPVNSSTARKSLFAPKRGEVRILPEAGLSESDAETLTLVLKEIPFYGAAVVAPDEGLMSEATQAVSQHHSVEAASAVALELCNKARKKGGADCVVAAHVVPRRYKPQILEMSHAATAAFRKQYRKLRGEKAFAISPKTGGPIRAPHS